MTTTIDELGVYGPDDLISRARQQGADDYRGGQVLDTTDEESSILMRGLGLWDETTAENVDHRNAICDAYNEGVSQASGQDLTRFAAGS